MRGGASHPAPRSSTGSVCPTGSLRGPAIAWSSASSCDALKAAIGTLTERQREVFAAIALNEVPIDVLAIRLGSNRNAIYKNLFDARRTLRASLARAGHPVIEEDAVTR